ncbi:MAG TPA: EamA family transporter [Gemmataceae bacterium]|nr:EamA family transporter [Gemmataceae bacterium]
MADQALSPVGLALATATSVSNVFTDVARKKVVDRNELLAGTFWIRFFAALVFGVAVGWLALQGSPPIIHPTSILTAADFKDPLDFAAKLTNPDNPVAVFLLQKMSEDGRSKLTEYIQSNAGDEKLLQDLAKELNKVLESGTSIYGQTRFAYVSLSAETLALQEAQPRGAALAYLNRLLLEDAFPGDIVKQQGCVLFGISNIVVAPLTAFLIYAVIDVALMAMAHLLLMRALQVSPMSMCMPFMSFTMVFLVPTSYIMLGELPTLAKLMGVALIVIGSLVMHRKLFAGGWTAPIAAIARERGSRFVLLVALLLSITSPIQKQLTLMSDAETQGFANSMGLCLLFAGLAVVQKANCVAVMRKTPGWCVVAGLLDAISILLLYYTFGFLPTAIAISIKRAGIILHILAGWLIFHEKNITDKLIAASVMLAGALFFYIPFSTAWAAVTTAAVLMGLWLALYRTRAPAIEPSVAELAAEKGS